MKSKLLSLLPVFLYGVLTAQHSFQPGVNCYSKDELLTAGDSVKAVSQQIMANPGNARLYGKRAYYKAPGGDYAGALLDYDTAISLDKTYKNACFSRGLMELYFNKCREAKRDFEKTVELDPADCQGWASIGDAYRCMDSGSLSVTYYNKALKCSPENPSFLKDLAYFYSGQKDEAHALQFADSAILKGYAASDVFALKGHIAIESKKYPEAIAAYTLAINNGATSNERLVKPEWYAEFFFNRGYCYDELNNAKKALEDYSQAIALDKKDEVSLYNRGLLYLAVHKRKLAGADFYAAAVLGDKDALDYLRQSFHILYIKYLDEEGLTK